jgi:glucokinase
MRKPFVVISGLPGSGKTTLGRRMAPALNLPVIDKDDILDRLFESKGIGDTAWRRRLSRESDLALQEEAVRSNGAILVSFWHLLGMPADSGTPTAWLAIPTHHVVNVHCACEPEIAASRLLQRHRRPGHLDADMSSAEVLASLQRLVRLPALDIGHRIEVNTSQEPDLTDIVRVIRHAIGSLRSSTD